MGSKKAELKKKESTVVVTWGWGLRGFGQMYKLGTSTQILEV